ncbi:MULTISPECIES: hypothetical protein [unclassified Streptomyces]|uniref:hypothetical protein n=1 Tax=unclassified Streptomyces TaxID=2593676 RepID=UPI0006B06765|nr:MULTISPECIES: hypothetical protein [unclassified Streptomyces]KOX25759.1 hypothetical protein ADL06_18380 [Streptomyces sp. NRRL F-6491]KOX50649.1 hypothetical protein ADL08_05945 [Streptomyces sp. NRRL F-6492]
MATRMLPRARRHSGLGLVPAAGRPLELRLERDGHRSVDAPGGPFPAARVRQPDATTRLAVPAGLHTGLGRDAVGVPARFGFKILSRLPANGCVYADSDWWWWLVPAGSDLDLTWPLPACYAPGAKIPDRRPRLIHHPDGASPYTPPIPLYLLTCQLTGIAPAWSAPSVRSAL